MKKLQLIAETPRAGSHNHRFIASKESELSDKDIGKMIVASRQHMAGHDYLAISSETVQQAGGRFGNEVLVLSGINVKKLSHHQRINILLSLKARLTDLETLVTKTIDWEQRENSALVCKRSELSDWVQDFSDLSQFKQPPPAGTDISEDNVQIYTPSKSARTPVKTQSSSSHTKIYVVMGLLVLGGLGGLGMWMMTQPEENALELEDTASKNTIVQDNLDKQKTKDAAKLKTDVAKLLNFDESQINDQQQKLRAVFLEFRTLAQNTFDEAPDSSAYPVLSFVYKVTQTISKLELEQKTEENHPFFTNNDLTKAKFLTDIIKVAYDNNLLIKQDDTVFEALCQLSDKETVKRNSEYRIQNLCISHNNSCENFNSDKQRAPALAFLKFSKKIQEHLECSTYKKEQ